jgi:hypothetical protein
MQVGPADKGAGGLSSPAGNWLRHVTAVRALREVTLALAEASIPLLPVKGIATADLLYGDVAARPLNDIDVRIRTRDFARAVSVAKARGWYVKPDALLWQSLWRVQGWEIDVKSCLGPPGLCAVSVDDVMRRAESRVEPFGFTHLRAELHDHALELVINAFKDSLQTTPWSLEDLRRIVRHPDFDAARLVERARRGRVVTATWLVADWMVERHAAEGWLAVRDGIGPAPPSARVARLYAWWRGSGSPPKRGLFVLGSASDDLARGVAGLALAAAGAAQYRAWVVWRGGKASR